MKGTHILPLTRPTSDGSAAILDSMAGGKLLLVEDDPALAGGLVVGLKEAGFEVELLAQGADVVAKALDERHDMIVLDLMLPDVSGFEILKSLQNRSAPPVIVLTARADLEDRLRAFALGAIDYLCKPFWIEELVARIRARLGIAGALEPPTPSLSFGSLSIDVEARRVTVAGESASLTKTELDILVYLAKRSGRAMARSQIAEQVLTAQEHSDPRTVDAHVTNLRRKLGVAGGHIATVWGIGYRFDAAASK